MCAFYRPSFNMCCILDLSDDCILHRIDLEVIVRYFLDDRDPTIKYIINEYDELVEDVESQRIYGEDGIINLNQACITAFNLNKLPSKGIDLHKMTYNILIDHIVKDCCTIVKP